MPTSGDLEVPAEKEDEDVLVGFVREGSGGGPPPSSTPTYRYLGVSHVGEGAIRRRCQKGKSDG